MFFIIDFIIGIKIIYFILLFVGIDNIFFCISIMFGNSFVLEFCSWFLIFIFVFDGMYVGMDFM